MAETEFTKHVTRVLKEIYAFIRQGEKVLKSLKAFEEKTKPKEDDADKQ